MLVFFISVVAAALLLVFGIGAITFNSNLLQWVDQHWELLRSKVQSKNMSDFKYHVSSELSSLGAFSFTIIISTLVMVCALASIIGPGGLFASLFPLINLLYVVFSSAIFVIAIYTHQHSYFASSLPIWTNYILSGIALFIFGLAILGYVTYKSISSFLLSIYISMLAIASVMFLIAGAGLLIIGERAIEEIK